MAKNRNIAFIVIACCMLLLAIGNICADRLIPGYAADERSYLEGRKYQTFPQMNAETVQSGQFQDQFEQYISDRLPKKHRMMLVNAQTQRAVIYIARIPFGYDVVPTYYGSGYVTSIQWKSIAPIPPKQTGAYSIQHLEQAANITNDLVARYPSIQWCLALVDRPSISLASPSHGLISASVDYSYLKDEYLLKLTEGCPYIDLSISDTEEYYSKYFKTDHHWQIEGAVEAYQAVVRLFGHEPISDIEYYTAFKGPFYGSEARNGLILEHSDMVQNISYRPQVELAVTVNGQAKPQSFLCYSLDASKEPYKKSNQLVNVYGAYFHSDYALIEISNNAAETEESLLIIGDSFTNNIERLFTEHYKTVYVLDPREFEGSIRSFLDSHDVDDAALILSNNTLFDDKVLNKMR